MPESNARSVAYPMSYRKQIAFSLRCIGHKGQQHRGNVVEVVVDGDVQRHLVLPVPGVGQGVVFQQLADHPLEAALRGVVQGGLPVRVAEGRVGPAV